MIKQEDLVGVMVTSGFGHNTQRPYVQVVIEAADWSSQMPPEKARELAFNLLSAADAAESDGFLVTFLQQRIGVDDMRALASVLVEFRDYREAQRYQQATGKGDANGA